VSAVGDALCLTSLIIVVAWLLEKLNWAEDILSWNRVITLFCGIFLISLIYRLWIRPRKKSEN